MVGELRIRASAEDPLRLRRIRIEGRPSGTSKWYCIAERDARSDGSRSEMWFDWDSAIWPSPEDAEPDVKCTHTLPHIHGKPTPNGGMELRTAAISFADDSDIAYSPVRRVDLRNPAAAPRWSEKPNLSSSSRAVKLSWAPNEEPDIVAYAIDRVGPDGKRKRRLIDASNPESDGCSRAGAVAINCSDALPAKGGTYSYTLVALRPGGSVKCLGSRCVASPPSPEGTVEAEAVASGNSSDEPSDEPSPGASDDPQPSPSGSANVSDQPSSQATPSTDDPSGDPVAAPSDDSGGSALPLILLALALIGGSAALFLRSRTRSRA